MHQGSCLGHGVDCYNVEVVVLYEGSIVSQRVFLCTAGHDYTSADFSLVAAPISIGARAWIAAEAYIGPGVSIGEYAVVGSRAVVTKDVPPRMVVVGNPARVVKERHTAQ